MNQKLTIISMFLGLAIACGCGEDAERSVEKESKADLCCDAHATGVPRSNGNQIDWGAIQVSLTDSGIAHFRKRALELMNDEALWKRLGEKYKGPFTVAPNANFEYQCERVSGVKATIGVIIPIEKHDFPHAWFVRIVFRQYFTDKPDQEVESIDLGYY